MLGYSTCMQYSYVRICYNYTANHNEHGKQCASVPVGYIHESMSCSSNSVLEIEVGHGHFPTEIAGCLNNFGFGRTKWPGKLN